MYCHEVRSVDEVALDLQLGQGRRDAKKNVSSAKQRRAKRHEVGDGVVAIADQFVEDAGDQGESFGVVEADAAGEAALSELPGLGDEELVNLETPCQR